MFNQTTCNPDSMHCSILSRFWSKELCCFSSCACICQIISCVGALKSTGTDMCISASSQDNFLYHMHMSYTLHTAVRHHCTYVDCINNNNICLVSYTVQLFCNISDPGKWANHTDLSQVSSSESDLLQVRVHWIHKLCQVCPVTLVKITHESFS